MDIYINREGHKALILIDHPDYESIGINSIIGGLTEACVKQGYSATYLTTMDVHIYFVQSSEMERRQRGAPEEVIMPEHVPACLLDDVLWLSKKVNEIHIKTVPRNIVSNPPRKVGGEFVW
jgi:hypothetical protein